MIYSPFGDISTDLRCRRNHILFKTKREGNAFCVPFSFWGLNSLSVATFSNFYAYRSLYVRRNHNVARKGRERRACIQATEASEITDDFLQKRAKPYATRTSRERLQKRAVMSAFRQDLRFFRVARFKTKREGNAFCVPISFDFE